MEKDEKEKSIVQQVEQEDVKEIKKTTEDGSTEELQRVETDGSKTTVQSLGTGNQRPKQRENLKKHMRTLDQGMRTTHVIKNIDLERSRKSSN